MKLTNMTADTLDDNAVHIPQYDRSKLKPGVLQIGVTNFHRSHMATYFDDLFEMGLGFDYAIVGAGVRNSNIKRREIMKEQDYLNTIVKRDEESTEARVIGPMIDHIPVELEDESNIHGPLKAELLKPEIKIVSLTVTEGGYYLHSDGHFDKEHPDIRHDADTPDNPITVPGMLAQALKVRRDKGVAPFTVMSCDNVPHNGDVTKEAVVGVASLIDPQLSSWIESHVGFPNSMVDRITPATSDEDLEFVDEKYDIIDKWATFAEPFKQWIIEDKFPSGRPPLEEVGVQFVDDVTPYEIAKIRILNGGHATLSYPSALLDLEFVHDAMGHAIVGAFVDAVERNEIIPGVGEVPDTNLSEYWQTVSKRFSNPTIQDSIVRNCENGSDRQNKFIVPPIQDCIDSGRSLNGLALVSALWCVYCQGQKEDGSDVQHNDTEWEVLHQKAIQAKYDPSVWTSMEDIYGDTGKSQAFVDAFRGALKSIQDFGVEGAMQAFVDSTQENTAASA